MSTNNDEVEAALAFADGLAEKHPSMPFLPSVTLAQAVRDLRKEITELRKDKNRLDWIDERGPFDSWDRKEEAHVTIRRPVRETIDNARAAGEGK